MENFITGYPGHESEMRAAMLEVLGQEKYNFFFDKVSSGSTDCQALTRYTGTLTEGSMAVPRVFLHG